LGHGEGERERGGGGVVKGREEGGTGGVGQKGRVRGRGGGEGNGEASLDILGTHKHRPSLYYLPPCPTAHMPQWWREGVRENAG